MAHGRGRYGIDPRIARISPLWKHSSGSVVTLKMRPPATPFTSLDTFMAAHSPRRFCQSRQKYLLKPLTFDKRIGETSFAPVPDKGRPKSRSKARVQDNKPRSSKTYNTNRNQASSPSTSTSAQDSSSDQEQECNRVLPLGKCQISNDEDLINQCETPSGQYKPGSFRPSARLPFTFNRSASIPSTPRDATDLIAIGTISMTSQRQPAPKPMSRDLSPTHDFEDDDANDAYELPKQLENTTKKSWKTKATLNLRGCKYSDPMTGASPGLQARIAEMAQLELETIKYEKSRKVKKKSPT